MCALCKNVPATLLEDFFHVAAEVGEKQLVFSANVCFQRITSEKLRIFVVTSSSHILRSHHLSETGIIKILFKDLASFISVPACISYLRIHSSIFHRLQPCLICDNTKRKVDLGPYFNLIFGTCCREFFSSATFE